MFNFKIYLNFDVSLLIYNKTFGSFIFFNKNFTVIKPYIFETFFFSENPCFVE